MVDGGQAGGQPEIGELCGVMHGLLWLLEYAADDVAICVDSLYAGNELEEFWKKNCNAQLIIEGQSLLARVRTTKSVTVVHVKGHCAYELSEYSFYGEVTGSRSIDIP